MGMGMQQVQKAKERADQQSVSGNYLPKIYWADKKDSSEFDRTKTIRFLSNDVIVCKVYEFVPGGKEGKGRDFVDPASLVDDNGQPLWDWVDPSKDFFKLNDVSYPDFRGNLTPWKKQAKERIYALAIVREEYKDENGDVKIRDKMVKREWEDKDGNKKEETGPYYGHVKQAVQNFWNTMFRFYQKYGTITDRDYEITRNGNGTDTGFTFIQQEIDPNLKTQEQVDAAYKPPLTMEEFMKNMSSYESVYKWIVEGNSTAQLKRPQKHADLMDADAIDTSVPESKPAPAEEPSEEEHSTKPTSGGVDSLRSELEQLAKG
jgi:hypothetical protein